MKVKCVLVALLLGGICFITSPQLLAGEQQLKIHKADTIKTLLTKHVGKRVSIQLNSGAELNGLLSNVGANVVQLSELSGKDFYDALIRINNIEALVVKVRSN